ncbi:MAG: hypothetical protein H6837_13290 [Planctomycetes bacterium]|nr:hypothetical protein [Planctomycetota bacterium]
MQPSFPKCELAIGHGIECLFRANKFDEALKKIEEIPQLGEADRDSRG